jgi:hypothetical protein
VIAFILSFRYHLLFLHFLDIWSLRVIISSWVHMYLMVFLSSWTHMFLHFYFFRIEQKEWVYAEKIKQPARYRWHIRDLKKLRFFKNTFKIKKKQIPSFLRVDSTICHLLLTSKLWRQQENSIYPLRTRKFQFFRGQTVNVVHKIT